MTAKKKTKKKAAKELVEIDVIVEDVIAAPLLPPERTEISVEEVVGKIDEINKWFNRHSIPSVALSGIRDWALDLSYQAQKAFKQHEEEKL